jgi:hypothetical protein
MTTTNDTIKTRILNLCDRTPNLLVCALVSGLFAAYCLVYVPAITIRSSPSVQLVGHWLHKGGLLCMAFSIWLIMLQLATSLVTRFRGRKHRAASL